jgi:hypothetical protein
MGKLMPRIYGKGVGAFLNLSPPMRPYGHLPAVKSVLSICLFNPAHVGMSLSPLSMCVTVWSIVPALDGSPTILLCTGPQY